MKKQLSLLLILSFAAAGLQGCTPKDRPRKEHEAYRPWTQPETPNDGSVKASEFTDFNISAAYAAVADPATNLIATILKPLSRVILNKQFIENPRYHTTDMTQMINIFNRAFLILLEKKDQSADFKAIKAAYIATVFSGCSQDLRQDCINDRIFSDDGFHTRIMTRMAQDLDKGTGGLDELMKTAGSAQKCVETNIECRKLLEERYRLLAMGLRKRNRNYDGEFAFTYMKYSRALAHLIAYDKRKEQTGEAEAQDISTSYLTQVHAKIFATLIARYEPSDATLKDPEFKAFVENFNPWVYSLRQPDIFHAGTKTMFEFGTKCCLYKDEARTQIADSVKLAIADSQKSEDAFGISFQQMVANIKLKVGDKFFDALNMNGVRAQIENPNSSFYNEYFLVVDRLFRSHLGPEEVEMVLKNAPAGRTQAELPKMIVTYMKVYLMNMVIETNEYMAGIYNSSVTSDKVFEEATTRSRELTSRWHNIQGQIDVLYNVMGSYFKGQNLFSTEFNDANRLIKSVNRNIHYLSVYPNMIVMTYFLSKMKGSITVNTWWGTIIIDADKILDAFFDGGVESPWFRFGKDPERLDRYMLLYGWEYMLSTDALASFSSKDGTNTNNDRSLFFDLIFSKYIDDNIHDLRRQVNEYERTFYGSNVYSQLNPICDYEAGRTNSPPPVQISFLDLSKYTYSGMGVNGVNSLLSKFGQEPGDSFQVLRTVIDSRITYIRTLMAIVEADLKRRGQTWKEGEHPRDVQKGYEMIADLERLKGQVVKSFVSQYKRYFDCSLKVAEVERRRMNRLFALERLYLGNIFDMMKPMWTMDEKARAEESARLTADLRKTVNARFDSISGITFRMSKYDLLRRMQHRIESDIFTSASTDEKRVYGGIDPAFYKARTVKVYDTDGVERDKMVSEATANTIYLTGDDQAAKDAFIKEGMAAMNGKAGSFIEWQGQRTLDVGLQKYISTLLNQYLLGPVTVDGKVYEITKEEVAEAYTRMMASYTMDEFDIANAREAGLDGRFDRKFFENIMFESNGNRLAFFYSLMTETMVWAGTKFEVIEIPQKYVPLLRQTEEALGFAVSQNNLRPFVFSPSTIVHDSVKEIYGARVNHEFIRVAELFNHLRALESTSRDLSKFDRRLAYPLYLQDGQPVTWFTGSNALVDETKTSDFKINLDDFIRRSGNFYDTKEKVKFE